MNAIRSPQEEQARLADVIGLKLLISLAQTVCAARRKYPEFAVNHQEAADAVKSEMLEWEAQAMMVTRPDGSINEARLARAEEESLHVMATLARYLNREYGENHA